MTQCFGETIVGMMLKVAKEREKNIRIFCPETRPYFQGARLTATVCNEMGFDTTVITDNMPAYVMKKENVDTIILGCTHFIHFAPEIQKVAGEKISVIDSREGVVKQALKQLGQADSSLPEGIKNKTFFITGTPKDSCDEDYQNIAKKFNIPWGGYLD
jgi:methylthioribose-1-phosphate isomerase